MSQLQNVRHGRPQQWPRSIWRSKICTRDHSVQTQDNTTYQSGGSSAESYMNERRENKDIIFDSCW